MAIDHDNAVPDSHVRSQDLRATSVSSIIFRQPSGKDGDPHHHGHRGDFFRRHLVPVPVWLSAAERALELFPGRPMSGSSFGAAGHGGLEHGQQLPDSRHTAALGVALADDQEGETQCNGSSSDWLAVRKYAR